MHCHFCHAIYVILYILDCILLFTKGPLTVVCYNLTKCILFFINNKIPLEAVKDFPSFIYTKELYVKIMQYFTALLILWSNYARGRDSLFIKLFDTCLCLLLPGWVVIILTFFTVPQGVTSSY